jgi:RPA family protein
MAASEWSRYATELYRARVADQQARLDAYANGYPTEERTFFTEIETRVTFRETLQWLKGTWHER